MADSMQYSEGERACLRGLAVVGLLGLNGAFLYGLVTPGALASALSNPIAIAFIAEALVLVGLLAYLLPRWGISRVRWPWFIVLSLVGGLLFSVPVALLWRARRG